MNYDPYIKLILWIVFIIAAYYTYKATSKDEEDSIKPQKNNKNN